MKNCTKYEGAIFYQLPKQEQLQFGVKSGTVLRTKYKKSLIGHEKKESAIYEAECQAERIRKATD